MHTVARLRLPDLGSLPPIAPQVAWTLVGGLAVPLWATWPLLAALTSSSMPMFQYFALMYFSGAVVLALVPRGSRAAAARDRIGGGGARSSRWLAAAVFCFGLLGSSILFIRAFDHIPVAQANLLLYLWPVMVVAFCVPLGLARLRVTHAIGIGLGLAGAACVIGGDTVAASWTGIGLAAGGGFAWAVYVVFRIWQGADAPDAVTPGHALCAIAALVLHLAFEDTVVPSAGAVAGTVLVGIIPSALGNLA